MNELRLLLFTAWECILLRIITDVAFVEALCCRNEKFLDIVALWFGCGKYCLIMN